MNYHWPHTGLSLSTFSVSSGYFLPSIPLILESIGVIQRKFTLLEENVSELIDFFFYPICKVETKDLSHSLCMGKSGF
jgi:hypothetical protein